MSEPLHLQEWFPEPLSDEAAYAVHVFLEQFTLQFEATYYGQIRRYLERESEHVEQPPINIENDEEWDDSIDF